MKRMTLISYFNSTQNLTSCSQRLNKKAETMQNLREKHMTKSRMVDQRAIQKISLKVVQHRSEGRKGENTEKNRFIQKLKFYFFKRQHNERKEGLQTNNFKETNNLIFLMDKKI